MNESIVSKFIHIITNSPSEGKYDNLKQNIIRLLELSPREKARELLNMNDLGDRKPTELLNSMRHLNDSQQRIELFKELFLEQLPISTQQILAGLANDLSLDTLAEHVGAMTKFDLVNIIRIETQSTGTEEIGLCYYHSKFGNNETKCRKPCSYQGN